MCLGNASQKKIGEDVGAKLVGRPWRGIVGLVFAGPVLTILVLAGLGRGGAED